MRFKSLFSISGDGVIEDSRNGSKIHKTENLGNAPVTMYILVGTMLLKVCLGLGGTSCGAGGLGISYPILGTDREPLALWFENQQYLGCS